VEQSCSHKEDAIVKQVFVEMGIVVSELISKNRNFGAFSDTQNWL